MLMKNFKKALSVLLVTVMLLSAAPLAGFIGLELPELNLPDIEFNFSADAAEIVDSGTCGENLTWALGSNGVLTISGTGAINDYSLPADVPWHSIRSRIVIVYIEDGVTSIGRATFAMCDSLISVTIPMSVTNIEEYSFGYCTSLSDVFYSGDKAEFNKIRIGTNNADFLNATYHFSGSNTQSSGDLGENLTWTLDNTGTMTITGTGEMYNYSEFHIRKWESRAINKVIIHDGMTSIGSFAFLNLYFLTSITIPDSVTSIGKDAFSGCASLPTITIPESVTSIGQNSFFGCTSMTEIAVDADNAEYCSIDGVLFNKSKTELIHYPGGNKRTSYSIPDSVTSIGEWAFNACSLLTSVTIPESVTSIGNYTFSDCPALVIRGYLGSYAQQYAEENNMPFIALNGETTYTLGDVDNNGKLEEADASLALRAAVNLEALTETQTKAADADKDGILEAADARLILRAAVGLGTL